MGAGMRTMRRHPTGGARPASTSTQRRGPVTADRPSPLVLVARLLVNDDDLLPHGAGARQLELRLQHDRFRFERFGRAAFGVLIALVVTRVGGVREEVAVL